MQIWGYYDQECFDFDVLSDILFSYTKMLLNRWNFQQEGHLNLLEVIQSLNYDNFVTKEKERRQMTVLQHCFESILSFIISCLKWLISVFTIVEFCFCVNDEENFNNNAMRFTTFYLTNIFNKFPQIFNLMTQNCAYTTKHTNDR